MLRRQHLGEIEKKSGLEFISRLFQPNNPKDIENSEITLYSIAKNEA